MPRIIFTLALSALVLAASPLAGQFTLTLRSSAAAPASAWPTVRGDAAGSGAAAAAEAMVPTADGIAKAIAELGSQDADTVVRAQVYLRAAGADAADALKATAAGTGDAAQRAKEILDTLAQPQVLWTLQGEEFFTASPAVDDKAVYAADRAGNFYAADRFTGAKLWQAKLPALTNCSPTVTDDAVYIACHDGSILRFAKDSHKPAWTFTPKEADQVERFIWDSLAVDAERVYAARADGVVLALKVNNGEEAWRFVDDAKTADGKPSRFQIGRAHV